MSSTVGRIPALLVLALVGALGAVLAVVVSAAPAARASEIGDTYVPLTPARVLDTRLGVGAPNAAVAAHGTLQVDLQGQGGIPPSGVDAVVVTLTVPAVAQGGHLTAYPTGTERPDTSNLSFAAHVTTAGSAVVQLGGGSIDLYNGSAGPVQLVADVTGYYAAGTSTAPGAYVPVAPARLLDTRYGLGAPKAAVSPHGNAVLQVAGRGGVPASGAGAAVITVTVTAPAASGHLTVFADGTARPATSNLNFAPRSTIANLAVVRLGSDGEIALYNDSSGSVQLIADVVGFHRSGTVDSAGAFVATDSQRVLDTRSGLGAPKRQLVRNAELRLQVAGRAGVADFAVGAVALNITITNPSASGHVAFTPAGTSFLNYDARDTRAELMVAPVDRDGFVTIYTVSAGAVDVLADVAGYFLTGPAITALSPPNGSMSGGQTVTVTGLGFTPDSSVLFGNVPAAATTLDGPGTMTVTAPGHAAGLVDITVTTAYGTSAIAPTDGYYFFEPAHPLTWSGETPMDPLRGQVTSVSCPTVDFCAALDEYGYVSIFNGSQWGTPTHPTGLGASAGAISCPAAGACVAMTGDGRTATLEEGAWGYSTEVPGGFANLLSCPTTTFCIAGGTNDYDLYTLHDYFWTSTSVGKPILAVSCASTSFCVATDADGDALTYEHGRWSAPVALDPGHGLPLLSCPSQTFCLAVDDARDSANVFRYDGASWHRSVLPDEATPVLELACSSPGSCMVIDRQVRSLTFDGTSWSAPTPTPAGWRIGDVLSLSCAGPTLCVLGSAGDESAVFTGAQWTLMPVDPPEGNPDSIACVSPQFCAAADEYGNVLTSDGATWSALTYSGAAPDQDAVSCASNTFCMFVTDEHFLPYDGTAWGPLGALPLGGEPNVSCPSPTHCVAVDAAGGAALFDGTAWTSLARIRSGPLPVYDRPGISCPTTTFCAVVYRDGPIFTWTDGTWTQSSSELPDASEVSCTSATFCMAVSTHGMVSSFDGSIWATPAPLDAGSTHVSCSAATHCLLTGTDSEVWDGSAWSAPVPVPTASAGPISCVSDSWCMALTASGALSVTDP